MILSVTKDQLFRHTIGNKRGMDISKDSGAQDIQDLALKLNGQSFNKARTWCLVACLLLSSCLWDSILSSICLSRLCALTCNHQQRQ